MSRPATSGDVWASWWFMLVVLLMVMAVTVTLVVNDIRTDLKAIQPCTQGERK